MRQAGWCALLGALVLVLAGCGGGGKKGETETVSEQAKVHVGGSL